jgi:TPR repeat protein
MRIPAFLSATALVLCVPEISHATIFTGTGFFISRDGYIATNNHVVDVSGEIRVRVGTGTILAASVVLRDVANDLAVIKVNGTGFPVLAVRNSSVVKKGATVFTLGFPNTTIQGKESKVTEGVISSLSGIAGEPNSFQISVPIQPGNSGGPLVDMTGAVVGLTTAKLSAAAMIQRGGQLPENVNYAVKSNYLLELVATDRNLAKHSLKPTSDKIQPLTTLVEKAEGAVVFIVVDTAAERSRPEPRSAEESPRFERDAQAVENYRLGMAAYDRGDYQEALVKFGNAVRYGSVDALYYLGRMYADAKGVSRDEAEANRLYRKAADLGNGLAQYQLGHQYEFGVAGIRKNLKEAARLYRAAADQGNVEAQVCLGRMYANGVGVTKDESQATTYYGKAAEQGSAVAQYQMGNRYENGLGGLRQDYVEAFNWYKKSASQRNPDAQFCLGKMYAYGRGVEGSWSEASYWYREAAASGNSSAEAALQKGDPTLEQSRKQAEQGDQVEQMSLGDKYQRGLGVPYDPAEALKWYRMAAENGNDIAQNTVAKRYRLGEGVPKDEVEAAKWYRKAADRGNADAQNALGFMYENGQGGLPKDYAEAAKWYGRAAEHGLAIAQTNIGIAYRQGHGVEKSDAEAVKWFRKAADQGNPSGQTWMGVMHENGLGGLEKSDKDAVAWYRKAADQGYAPAQTNLGRRYRLGSGLNALLGTGIRKDELEAVKWYRKAADQGNAEAQNDLGFMYENGQGGLPKDYAEAAKWYRRSAEQGLAIAQTNIGTAYRFGRGVEKDDEQAAIWFRKAADQGSEKAKEALKAIGR